LVWDELLRKPKRLRLRPLTRIETKRAQDQTSPRGGIDFEDEVTRFVNAATLGGPCVAAVALDGCLTHR